jgi:hypothetical protein
MYTDFATVTYAGGPFLENNNNTHMANSKMEDSLSFKGLKVLKKASFIDGDMNLTVEGRQELLTILLGDHIKEMVDIAIKKIEEEKEKAKKE